MWELLTHSDLSERSVTIIWKLEENLPEEAKQRFNITYLANGKLNTITTTDSSYELTDLNPGQTYTIFVILSYAYTLKTTNKAITINTPHRHVALTTIIPSLVSGVVFIFVVILIVAVSVAFCNVNRRVNKNIKALKRSGIMPPKKLNVHSTTTTRYQEISGGRTEPKVQKRNVCYAILDLEPQCDEKTADITRTDTEYATINVTSLVGDEDEGNLNLEQIKQDEKRIYYSNLAIIPDKKTDAHKPLNLDSRLNEYHGYSREAEAADNDVYYTPMGALNSEQLPAPPIYHSTNSVKLISNALK